MENICAQFGHVYLIQGFVVGSYLHWRCLDPDNSITIIFNCAKHLLFLNQTLSGLALSSEVIETKFKNFWVSHNDHCSMNSTMNDPSGIELFIANKTTNVLRANSLRRCHVSKYKDVNF